MNKKIWDLKQKLESNNPDGLHKESFTIKKKDKIYSPFFVSNKKVIDFSDIKLSIKHNQYIDLHLLEVLEKENNNV